MTAAPLSPEALFSRTDPAALDFETTADLEPGDSLIGQDRAVAALAFGLDMPRDGYNIFAHGPPQSDKFGVVRRVLEARAAAEPAPRDLCYVNNFERAEAPILLALPAGVGSRFLHEVDRLVDDLQGAIPALFESDDYRARRQVVDEEFRDRQEAAFEILNEHAKEKDAAMIRTPMGLALAPTRGGEVLRPELFQKLPEPERQEIEAGLEALQKELQEIMTQIPRWEKERRDRIRDLNKEMASFAVGHLIDALRTELSEHPGVIQHLAAIESDIVENVDQLAGPGEAPGGAGVVPLPNLPNLPSPPSPASVFRRYRVNLIVDHGATAGAPVVFEDHPIYANLIGRIEYVQEMGALVTDFRLIRPGALLQANGGYLILDARKMLVQPLSWEALKRALRSRQVKIETYGQITGFGTTLSPEPEPVPLDLKVVLIGDRMLYYLLAQHDPEFKDLFKVPVDFDDEIRRDAAATGAFARAVAGLIAKEGLRPFDRGAVARITEHAARIADDAAKLTAKVDLIGDLLCETDYWAGQAGRQTADAGDVQRAIDARRERSDRLRLRGIEMITDGTVLIDTAGEDVGQVNGLSVLSIGDTAFGRPSRITARVRMGSGEVVDIERKVALGGPLHSKGVYILQGFLGARYALDRPLSLSASLVFEQSYGGIDGDSASSTELYALLSALAEVPIRQSFAVTGSVNQHGEVQAIGGVNEKIEGFFDICDQRGLTGEQGVLIPAANVRHLMLRADVVEAARAGRFRIYPVESIDQGIEILTGMPAGERGADGQFPDGSINRRVEQRLIELAETRRRFARGRADGEGDDEDENENGQAASDTGGVGDGT